MTDDSPPSFQLTPSEIAQWQEQCAQIDLEIERLQKDKSDIKDRLRAAQLLAPSLFLLAQPPKAKGRGNAVMRKGLPTWAHIIEEAVRNSGTGIRQKDLLDSIRSGRHGKRLDGGEGGYYNAIQKVLSRKIVIKRGEWLFTPAQFQEYMRKVDAGEIADHAENTEYGSASAAEIVRYVLSHQGAKSPAIIDHIWAVQEANGEAQQSRTSLYNVIRRLVDQKKLSKDGRGGFVPYKENEPPAELPLDGSDTEGAATPSFENVVGFHRPR